MPSVSDSDDAPRTPGRPLPHLRGAAHAQPREGTSRRWFLAGGAAVVLAAGGGVGAGLVLGRHDAAEAEPAPDALVAAVEAERALIADLDATTGGEPAVRQVIAQARADHAAHLRVLRALLADYRQPVATASSSPAPRGRPRTAVDLRRSEQRASSIAARHAMTLDGPTAALLASIAACEATHAELLA